MNSKVQMVLRIILGLILIIFGANKFLQFMPPISAQGNAETYLTGLAVSGYIFPLLGILEILIGALLIFNKAVPFALILLAPLTINMVLFHATMDPGEILPAAVVFLLNAILIYANWDRFKSLFK